MNELNHLTAIGKIMPDFYDGLTKAVCTMFASGATLFIANEAPPQFELVKFASGLTGWGLALTTIYILGKTVKHLFEKLELKDKRIEELHERATRKAEHENNETTP